MNKPLKIYSRKEELLNIYSHLLGSALSLIGLGLLILKALQLNTALHTLSYTIYGTSMLVLFLASTLYHSAKSPVKRQKLQVFDHAAIYFLIAGTYTPFALLGLKGTWGWAIFGIVWGIGIAGMALKLFFTGKYNLLSTLSYIAMGWVIIVAIKPLTERLTTEALSWLFIGGAFYTLGAVLYSIKRIPLNHAIFHLFVLLGAFSHFWAVYQYL